MQKINGFHNEYQFVAYLNHRKVKNCHPLFQELLFDLYSNLKDEDEILSWKNHELQKTDIFIKINNIVKRVSLKCGIKNSVHSEPISEFIHFLIENKISKANVTAYLKYHYADGTTNGTGIVRMPIEEYKKLHQQEIDEINLAFNQKDILENMVKRFVLQGRNSKEEIDVLIYGTIYDFMYLKNEEIKEIICNSHDSYSTAVHVGPLTIQPILRNLNHNSKYDRKRFMVQVKWYCLHDDIINYRNSLLLKSCPFDFLEDWGFEKNKK